MSPWKIAGVEIRERRTQKVFRTLTDLEPNTFYEIKTTVFETNEIFTEEILNFTTPNCSIAGKFDKLLEIKCLLNIDCWYAIPKEAKCSNSQVDNHTGNRESCQPGFRPPRCIEGILN